MYLYIGYHLLLFSGSRSASSACDDALSDDGSVRIKPLDILVELVALHVLSVNTGAVSNLNA